MRKTMATKLTKAGRDKAQLLLEQHSDVTEALAKIGKRGYVTLFNVTHTKSGHYTNASLSTTAARRALTDQKREIEAELKTLRIELA